MKTVKIISYYLITLIILIFCFGCNKTETEPVEEPTAEMSEEPSAEPVETVSKEPSAAPEDLEITPRVLEEVNADKPIYEDEPKIPEELKEYYELGRESNSYVPTDEREADVLDYCRQKAAKDNESVTENTYVYAEDEIYRRNFPNCDYCKWWGNSVNTNFMMSTFVSKPTDGIRENEDGSICLIYDTDTSLRIFTWYKIGPWGWYDQFGYVIYMAETLSYSDFEHIQIGDYSDVVAEIDPKVTEISLRHIIKADKQIENTLARIENGVPPRSLHLLTDGLLIITYSRDEDGFYITDIEFNEDFMIDTRYGSQCCKINPLDYVTQG